MDVNLDINEIAREASRKSLFETLKMVWHCIIA